MTAALQTHYPFYIWDESASIVRLMASFDTTEEDVDGFIAALIALMDTTSAS